MCRVEFAAQLDVQCFPLLESQVEEGYDEANGSLRPRSVSKSLPFT